jgi:hypothetical protein
MSHLELNLYENALDSIRHAIEHYTSQEPETRRYKYTILHLTQGILLLLKERLSREHPSLIYKNVSDIGGMTIDHKMLISRLSKIAGVELGDDEKTIGELVKARNNIEHYALELKQASVDSLIGRLVPFLIGFCQEELGTNFKATVGHETWQTLQTIQSYRQHAIKAAKERILATGQTAQFCPSCLNDTALESTFPVQHSWQEEIPGRTGYRIECRACLAIVAHGQKCQECAKNIPHVSPEPFLRPEYSYCAECKTSLRQEFPGLSLPMYVAEVRRWFKDHNEITIKQLLDFVHNVAMHGPTGVVRYPRELLQYGVIDYASDYYRARNERVRAAINESQIIEDSDFFGPTSLRGDERFVWSWQTEQNGKA